MQSFDTRVLLQAHVRNRRVPAYFLTEALDGIERHLDSPWAGINFRHDLLTPAVVERVQARGKRVGAWTPNTEAELRRVIETGLNMIITDEPLLALDLLRSMRPDCKTNGAGSIE